MSLTFVPNSLAWLDPCSHLWDNRIHLQQAGCQDWVSHWVSCCQSSSPPFLSDFRHHGDAVHKVTDGRAGPGLQLQQVYRGSGSVCSREKMLR